MKVFERILAWVMLTGGLFASLSVWPIASTLSLLLISTALARIPAMQQRFPPLLPLLMTITLSLCGWATLTLLPWPGSPLAQGILTTLALAAGSYWAYSTQDKRFHGLPGFQAMMYTSAGVIAVSLLYTLLVVGTLPDPHVLLASWFVLALVYPKRGFTAQTPLPRKTIFVFPILAVFFLWFHAHSHARLQNELSISGTPLHIAQQARHAGYTTLYRSAIALETERLLRNGNWAEAAQTQHRSWANEERWEFVETFREVVAPEAYPFFSSVAFGSRFWHPAEAEWYDMQVLPARQEIWLMDWSGGLWVIGEKSTSRIDITVPGASAFHVFPEANRIAILGDRSVFCREGEQWLELPLPEGQRFTDLHFSNDGNRLWMLHANAEIDFYIRLAPGVWDWGGNLMLPLWGEENRAVSFVVHHESESFTVLDLFGGTYHRRSSVDTVPFSPFHDPYRPDSRDLIQLSPERFALMDQFGRIDFIDVEEEITEGGGARNRDSVKALLAYDSGESKWTSKSTAVAISYLAETNTILQLHRDGRIQPIVLPSGYRIRYRSGFSRLPLPEQPVE